MPRPIARPLGLTFFLLISLLVLSTAAAAQTRRPSRPHPKIQAENGLFWQITKPNSADTSYLFGTLHLLEKSYVDTLPRLMAALRGAEIVVGEIVIDSVAKEELLSSTTMETSLSKLISKRDYALLSKETEELAGLPIAFFEQFKPMVLYAMLLQGLYKKAHPENHKSGIPMDLFFQQFAKKNAKRVVGLETAEDQADLLFDSLPVKRQAKELMDFIRDKDKSLAQMETMLRDYHAGRIASIMSAEDMQSYSKKEMEALLYGRNKRWLGELPALLDHNKVFVAVGAGHLVGDRGLILGLRKKGYDVVSVSPN